MRCLLVLIALSALPSLFAYTCADVIGKRLVTRFWELEAGATFTTQEVADTFETGFGPQVSAMDGFNVYVGTVVNSTNNFFFNVFDDQTTGDAAQAAASAFVTTGVLDPEIAPVLFLEGDIAFLITSDTACLNFDASSYHLATRLWTLQSGGTYTQQQVSDEFESGFGPTISAQPGFIAYGSMIVDDTTHNFFFNIFTTAQGATDASALAAAFVADGVLNDQIDKVQFLEAAISFDIGTGGLGAASSVQVSAWVLMATVVVAFFVQL